MRHLLGIIFSLWLLASAQSHGQATSPVPAHHAPLRIGIVGLVHGHVDGFFRASLHNPEIEVVGIAEPDRQLSVKYAKQYGIDRGLLFPSLEEMLRKVHPQAVLAYTTTYDHRRAVEICARHGAHVMMEKPLAVSLEDALAIQRSAQQGKIHVLVNYETTWYSSNRVAYDLVQENAIGGIRKIVVHDGHQGPKEIGVGPEFLAWLTNPKLDGGGALFDFGCYGADLVTWLMDGRRPESVTAVTQHIKPDTYPRVDDEATIILTYPKAQAIIQASWNWPFGRKDLEVYGQTGYIITVGSDDIRERLANEPEKQIGAKPLPAPYNNSLAYFRAVIDGEIKSEGLSSLETNVTVTKILDAARRSAASGRTIELSAK